MVIRYFIGWIRPQSELSGTNISLINQYSFDPSALFQLPVITNLRNPALKPRHWEHIQQIFGYHFTEEEPLTLGLLNKIDAFDHTEAIEEVSGQASSEASLEGILKKVCALIR